MTAFYKQCKNNEKNKTNEPESIYSLDLNN